MPIAEVKLEDVDMENEKYPSIAIIPRSYSNSQKSLPCFRTLFSHSFSQICFLPLSASFSLAPYLPCSFSRSSFSSYHIICISYYYLFDKHRTSKPMKTIVNNRTGESQPISKSLLDKIAHSKKHKKSIKGRARNGQHKFARPRSNRC